MFNILFFYIVILYTYNKKVNMTRRLSLKQQRELLGSMTDKQKIGLKKYCCACQHNGDGIKEIIQRVRAKLTPLIPFLKQIGEPVLKEVIIPMIIKKSKEKMGLGLSLAGSGKHGGALKLAGQGKKTSPWIAHVKKVAAEQNLSYKEALKVASKTYKK